MSTNNVLTWRPKPSPPVAADPELLWTMRKQRWQIDCTLQSAGINGWHLQVLLDGLPFFHRRFRSWEDAIEGAEDKYAELVGNGWTPLPLSPDDQYRPF